MKRTNVIKLWNALNLFNDSYNTYFSYFIAINKNRLKTEIKIMENLAKPSDKYIEFNKKREEIAKKYSAKDNDGKVIIIDNKYDIIDKIGFNSEFKELIGEYTETIDEYNTQMKEYNDFIAEEVEIKTHSIKFENLPNKITPEVIELFIELDMITNVE